MMTHVQLHLELGQSNFVLHTCSLCGMMYTRWNKDAEKVHKADATGEFPMVYKDVERGMFLEHALFYESYVLFVFSVGQVLGEHKVTIMDHKQSQVTELVADDLMQVPRSMMERWKPQ